MERRIMYHDDADAARANYDEIAEPASREWQADIASGKTYDLTLDPTELMCLIGAAQLGLRHPDYVGESHGYALAAVRKLVALYPPGSAQRILASQGFDSRFDVPSRADEQ